MENILHLDLPRLFGKTCSEKHSFGILRDAPQGYAFYIEDCLSPFVKIDNNRFMHVDQCPVDGPFDVDGRLECVFTSCSEILQASIGTIIDRKTKALSESLFSTKHIKCSDTCQPVSAFRIAKVLADSGLLDKIYEELVPIGLNDTIMGRKYFALIRSDDGLLDGSEFDIYEHPVMTPEGTTYRIVRIENYYRYILHWYTVVDFEYEKTILLKRPDNSAILSALIN